jgi:hypothetical protein
MLKAEGKINDVVIENMMNWPPARRALSLRLGERHSGFNVYCGNAIWPHNEEGLENLARYIIRASFSQERMTYIAADESADGVAQVIYESKDGKATKTFEALDWLAQLVTHIPNKGEQMVRYYGFYSNKKSSSTWTYGMSNANRLRAPTARRLKPLLSMTSYHRPAQMITRSMPTTRLKPTFKEIQPQANRRAMPKSA